MPPLIHNLLQKLLKIDETHRTSPYWNLASCGLQRMASDISPTDFVMVFSGLQILPLAVPSTTLTTKSRLRKGRSLTICGKAFSYECEVRLADKST